GGVIDALLVPVGDGRGAAGDARKDLRGRPGLPLRILRRLRACIRRCEREQRRRGHQFDHLRVPPNLDGGDAIITPVQITSYSGLSSAVAAWGHYFVCSFALRSPATAARAQRRTGQGGWQAAGLDERPPASKGAEDRCDQEQQDRNEEHYLCEL